MEVFILFNIFVTSLTKTMSKQKVLGIINY